jgi:hypothetical protein
VVGVPTGELFPEHWISNVHKTLVFLPVYSKLTAHR